MSIPFFCSLEPTGNNTTDSYHKLPLTFIRDELAFESNTQVATFLEIHRAAFYQDPNNSDDQKTFDCKPAGLPLAQVYDEKYRKATIKGAI